MLEEDLLQRVCGLRPQVWLSMGAGFVREEVKALLLSRGRGFAGDAILGLQEICLKITQADSQRLLSSSARQEVLRMLLAEPRILSGMEEIKRLKRQRNFLRRLDQAIQSGRLIYAHAEEEQVYHDRLASVLGESPLREELRAFARAYDAWLEASSWLDLPLLIRKATEVLIQEPEKITSIPWPQEIWVLNTQNPESLEKQFWDTLGQNVPIRWIRSLSIKKESDDSAQCEWQRWHTLDDAAESFADQFDHSPEKIDWNQHAVLIPDIPSIRRSLRRALEFRGIPVFDPRDPTRLRWDETLKWALLPLEVVARNFERQKVISWLRGYHLSEKLPRQVEQINSRGIRHGLFHYSGGDLGEIYVYLTQLEQSLSGRKTCEELGKSHINYLKSFLSKSQESSRSDEAIENGTEWLVPFLEQTWKSFAEDHARIEGDDQRRAPLLFWLERLQTRLNEASPPIEKLKPREGIRIYRLQQAPVNPIRKLWIFGLPQNWLQGNGTGSYWYSERDREILSAEFLVRSSFQVHDERLEVLKSWVLAADQVTVLDSEYDSQGREQESLLALLKELNISVGLSLFPEVPQEMGSHSRYALSYRAIRPMQPTTVELPPFPRGTELTATTLDRASRCSFQGLGYHRWKLRDLREPDTELWPDVRGNILHESVRLLLKSLNEPGQFSMLPHEALDLAWQRKPPKGLIGSPRVEKYVKARLVSILEKFCEKERTYLTRSGARPLYLEEGQFRLNFEDFSIIGQPDRIDEHPKGWFIMDYKSSGTVPHGTEMLERGYRLQLPFYALAAKSDRISFVSSQHSQPKSILGIQFIELDRKANRNNGIFFPTFNGKEKGCLTQVRSNSKSLITQNSEDVWSTFRNQIFESAKSYLDGKYTASPRSSKAEKECDRCSLADLCGFRRRLQKESEEEVAFTGDAHE